MLADRPYAGEIAKGITNTVGLINYEFRISTVQSIEVFNET